MSNLKPVQGLRPFTKFCMTIGNLPASYLVSMTYEEQLLWFCDYLKNTVIPTVNNNAEAVEELQNLYIELKSYVDNYFNNLDVQNEINYKLDTMVQDGTFEKYFSNFQNEINNLQNQIINKNQMSPRGVYNTLDDLIQANPDHNYIYVILSNNKWAYYNGSTWAEGGNFLTSSIGIITKSQTDFYNKYYNLFNKETVKNNRYVDSNNGNVTIPTDPGTYYASDYIEVLPNTPYIANGSLRKDSQYAWYNNNKEFISGGTINGKNKNPMISPTNAKYLRFTARTLDTIINQGSVPYSGEAYSNYYTLQNPDISFLSTKFIDYKRSSNIFNKNHCLYNYYVNQDGDVLHPIDGTTIYLSDFINNNYGEILSVYGRFIYVAEFDENYNFIEFYFTPKATTFSPKNEECKYIRIMTKPELLDNLTVIRGETNIEDYIPYYIPNIDTNSIDETMLNPTIRNKLNSKNYFLTNKVISFLGDSITWGYNGANPNTQVKNPFPKLIADSYKCTSYNLGINGSTISGDNSNIGYNSMCQRILNINKSSDYIIIFGGTNDFGSDKQVPLGTINDTGTNTFYGSLKTLFDNFYNNFNCKVGFITPLQRTNMNNPNNDDKILKDYVNAIKEVCNLYSIPVLDLFNGGNCYPLNNNFKTNNLPDGLHPNQNFYNVLAYRIGKFIENL